MIGYPWNFLDPERGGGVRSCNNTFYNLPLVQQLTVKNTEAFLDKNRNVSLQDLIPILFHEVTRMKTSSVKLGVIFFIIGLTIFGTIGAWGADWKLFDWSVSGSWYYDAESLSRSSPDIVRVWTIRKFTDKGVREMVKNFGKQYENIDHSKGFEEINCSKKRLRILSYTHYSKKGEVIHSQTSEGLWNDILPDSQWDKLYQLVCK
jgi:hypothetical protein